jgi:tetratricopeptide (TPR) repeat protein
LSHGKTDATRWARESGHLVSQCNAAHHLGMLHADLGEGPEALEWGKEALKIARGLGYELALVTALYVTAQAAAIAGDLRQAVEHFEALIAMLEPSPWRIRVSSYLALVHLAQGRRGDAEAALRDVHPGADEAPAEPFGAARAWSDGRVPDLTSFEDTLELRVCARFIRASLPTA